MALMHLSIHSSGCMFLGIYNSEGTSRNQIIEGVSKQARWSEVGFCHVEVD